MSRSCFHRGALSFALLVTFSIQSWGWGKKGHETVDEVAAHLLPRSSFSQLLLNNINAVKFLAMVPDMNWKHGANAHPLEGQAHFFSGGRLRSSRWSDP